MKDFLFVYRADYTVPPQGTPEQMQAMMKLWMDWLGSIGAQGKLKSPGHRLENGGKVVRPNNVITDGPYADIKESIGGYSIVTVATIEEAAEIAKGCPIYMMGGNVEVREVASM